MGYLAIDFETANEHRGSACALAVVQVEEDRIVDRLATLINPETYFAPMNVYIHGIDERAVAGAPTFADLAPALGELLSGFEAVVAHSASFDIQVMRASIARYDVDLPEFEFACTRVFARQWFPGWPSYALTYCTRELGIDDIIGDDHHNPVWDAEAAAHIALHGFRDHGHTCWADACERFEVRLGQFDPSLYRGCHSKGTYASTKIEPVIDPDAEYDETHPLYGLNVCFTGALAHYVRRDAAQLVADRGGHFAPGVTKKTDLLVVGEQDLAKLAGHDVSTKMRKAMDMAADGHHIEIIDELDFYRML